MKLELKKKLIADVRDKFGEQGAAVVEYLFEMGTLDEILARKHVVRAEMFNRLLTTKRSKRQLEEDIAEDCGITRDRVFQLVG